MKKTSKDYYSICDHQGNEIVAYVNECMLEETAINRCNDLVAKHQPQNPYIVVFNEIDTYYHDSNIFERSEHRKYFVVSCSWR